ncbi:MAG: urea carboxylase-associated family protein [Desulfobacteria bacterium]|jgi:hypothetical protein
MNKIFEKVMPGKTGLAVEVKQGQHLRVTDVEGQQVVDMAVWNLDNLREKLSTSYSRTRRFFDSPQEYYPVDHLEEGDWLLSTLCRPMMLIVKETPEPKGIHDACNRMCNRFLYMVMGFGPLDGCHEIISQAVASYGILPEDVPDSFDLFMDYRHDCNQGGFRISEPVSKPEDYVEFRAEMNCLVGLSTCPQEFSPCNAGKSTPAKVEIFRDPNYQPRPILSMEEWVEEELSKRKAKKIDS